MNPRHQKEALHFLYQYFDGIGENHPDYQEGMKAIKSLMKYIKRAEEMKNEWIGSLAEL